MSHAASPSESTSDASSLQQLVACFVAAKKSLSATTHVYKANEIVEDARLLVERAGVLRAKNTYVRSGIEEQVQVLQNIHGGLDAVGAEAQLDFSSVVKSLDVAHARLQSTLNSLRRTIVSSSLSSPTDAEDVDDSEGKGQAVQEPDKTLYDFIDEATHADLFDSVRATIDSYNDAQSALHAVRTLLRGAIDSIESSLHEIDTLKPENSNLVPADGSIPSSFTSLAQNATEMASLLQSLISHYDLCITALKHTEGGGDAARAAADFTDLNPLTSGTESPTEASLYAGATAEANRAPISEDERTEMLAVLAHDAAQVDDVVLEIGERADEMAQTLTALQALTGVSVRRFALLDATLDALASLSSTAVLSRCVSAPLAFRAEWSAIRHAMVAKIAALNDLAQFYDSFLASYASLLREVERRRMVEAKQRKIAERAMREIEALQAEDGDMRCQFVKETGEWLPRDIWPGLMEGPRKWVLQRERGGGGGGESVQVGLGIVQDDARPDEDD